MRIAFYTLGCKLNQFETEALASSFKQQNFLLVDYREEAEIFLVNTCTVTGKSEQKARRIIRLLAARHPDSLVLVTGCYAQLEAATINRLADNVLTISQVDKPLLLGFSTFLAENLSRVGSLLNLKDLYKHYTKSIQLNGESRFSYNVNTYSYHSRAFVKIQDGCDNHCSYCRVPLARGAGVSRNSQSVISACQEIEKKGYREIVLTGVNISSYHDQGIRLPQLLNELLLATVAVRYRLSSLEPDELSAEYLSVLKNARICPHFHIPVQSGSDKVLAAMQRRYNRAGLQRALAILRAARPRAFLAADIIVGFPGENAADFTDTQSLLAEMDFTRYHVFSFSPRPGTTAVNLKPRVADGLVKQRARLLLVQSEKAFNAYARSFIGEVLEAVVETEKSAGVYRGLTDNYLKFAIRGPKPLPRGSLVRIKVTDFDQGSGHADYLDEVVRT